MNVFELTQEQKVPLHENPIFKIESLHKPLDKFDDSVYLFF